MIDPVKTPLLVLDELTLGYREPLLGPLSLEIARAEFLGVVGPNGGGKSTLVRTLCGLLPPLAGRVRFPGGRPLIGYVPQRRHLDPLFPLTAQDLVALNLVPGLPTFGTLGGAHRRRARQALAQVGLEEMAGTPFRQLSGGQQQRALLARALVLEPGLIVLDEPTEGLDARAHADLTGRLLELHESRTVTIVLVGHDLALLRRHATRVLLVDHRNHAFRSGDPAEFLSGEHLREIYGLGETLPEGGAR